MPVEFDLRLQELIARFHQATTRKTNAFASQVDSTAGMRARLREAVCAVRELAVICSLLLQDDQPVAALLCEQLVECVRNSENCRGAEA